MRRRSILPFLLAAVAACQSGADAPVALRPSTSSATTQQQSWIAIVRPYHDELLDASAGLLYTSESDYPFDYVSRPIFLRDTLTVASFRFAFGVPRTTPVDVRDLDRFFARHIELVDPYDPVGVALVPRYEELKFQIRELLNAPKAYCVGTIQIRCYVVGTSPEGVVAGVATTSIET
jgi:hypothetical protein